MWDDSSNARMLSTIEEEDSTALQRPPLNLESSGSSSPLPELIVEREPNRHDESEEFYERLKEKIFKYYEHLFIHNRSPSSFEELESQIDGSGSQSDLEESFQDLRSPGTYIPAQGPQASISFQKSKDSINSLSPQASIPHQSSETSISAENSRISIYAQSSIASIATKFSDASIPSKSPQSSVSGHSSRVSNLAETSIDSLSPQASVCIHGSAVAIHFESPQTSTPAQVQKRAMESPIISFPTQFHRAYISAQSPPPYISEQNSQVSVPGPSPESSVCDNSTITHVHISGIKASTRNSEYPTEHEDVDAEESGQEESSDGSSSDRDDSSEPQTSPQSIVVGSCSYDSESQDNDRSETNEAPTEIDVEAESQGEEASGFRNEMEVMRASQVQVGASRFSLENNIYEPRNRSESSLEPIKHESRMRSDQYKVSNAGMLSAEVCEVAGKQNGETYQVPGIQSVVSNETFKMQCAESYKLPRMRSDGIKRAGTLQVPVNGDTHEIHGIQNGEPCEVRGIQNGGSYRVSRNLSGEAYELAFQDIPEASTSNATRINVEDDVLLSPRTKRKANWKSIFENFIVGTPRVYDLVKKTRYD